MTAQAHTDPLIWAQRGAGVDGDPLRVTTRLGDMTAEVLLSRGTGLWNARGSHIDGRLGLSTQEEGRDYAEVAMRVRAKERIAAATACLAALAPELLAKATGVAGT